MRAGIYHNIQACQYVPRKKIESVVRKGHAVLDPDAPDDAESTRYWTSTGGQATESTKERQVGSMKVHVKGSAAIAGSLMSGVGPGTKTGSMANRGAEEGLSILQTLKDAASNM